MGVQRTEDRKQKPETRNAIQDDQIVRGSGGVQAGLSDLRGDPPSKLEVSEDRAVWLGGAERRASKSICANLAEGFAKQRMSAPEFKRFLTIAVGSSDEMRVWLRYALDLGYIEEPTWQRWRDEYQEIARMLHGLRRNWHAS